MTKMRKLKLTRLFKRKKKANKLVSAKLEGKKVTLRKLVVSDAFYIHDTYEDLKNTKYHIFNQMKNEDDFMLYLVDYVARYDNGSSIGWAIISNKTKEFIGVIQVPYFYPQEKNCSLSFYIAQGLKYPYLCEAIELAISYLFSTKLIHRIQVKIDAEDTFSELCISKKGFKYEGTQRQYAFYGEKYHDVKVYSLLEDEIVFMEEK